MASFLDGMASSIYAGFKGKLRRGAIRRIGGATTLDAKGRPVGAAPIFHWCEGFDDNYSAFRRASEGIPHDSLIVNIFAASIQPAIAPSLDMIVRLDYAAANGQAARSRWFKLRERIKTDPATALWECEAQEVGNPDGG